MARRTKEEAEATKKAISIATLEIFCEKGYSRTTFDEIAKRINLTKGAVYWHFRNKADILSEIIRKTFEITKTHHTLGTTLPQYTSNRLLRLSKVELSTMSPSGKVYSPVFIYNTALHELGHSTGHAKRLNRDLSGGFGSENYALEELRAEIASLFMEQDFEISVNENEVRNNSAYIQSWKAAIKDDPNVLFTAIADAEKITKYVRKKETEMTKEVEPYAVT